MTNEFQLFPDIRLICSDKPAVAGRDELMICCCLSGVCEYHIGERYCYLTDETVLALSRSSRYAAFSSKDFRGIFLIIAPGEDSAELSEIFGISEVVRAISHNGTLIYQKNDRVNELLSAMLTGAEKPSVSLMRLKTIELLMLLGENRAECKETKKAEQIGGFICSNISEHFTIPQLSEMFRVNLTSLKSLFRRAYGCGIYAYIKKRKMFRAAELLIQTDMKIIDVAEEVGYCNASKFASAFHSVMGTTPKHFRMEHKPEAVAQNC